VRIVFKSSVKCVLTDEREVSTALNITVWISHAH